MIDNILYLNNYFTDIFLPNNFHKEDYTPISSQEKEIWVWIYKWQEKKNLSYSYNDLVSVSSKI